MQVPDPFLRISIALMAAWLLSAVAAVPSGAVEVAVRQNTDKLMPYQVFELDFRHENNYQDPTWDVSIGVRFTSPGGKRSTVGGFFYGSTEPQKPIVRGGDGSPFFPIGFQDGIFDNNHNGSVMDVRAVEGPFRLDPQRRRPTPPPGALFARGPAMGPINGDLDFRRHTAAGFDLWRFSPNNFSIKVFASPENPNQPTLDHVRWEQAAMVDEMLQMTRKYGIRNFYGIFGYTKVFNDRPGDRQGMAKVKRIIKYSVDRWGAYVDFWEFLNEQHADAGWYEIVIPYLKSIDPYHHPIATSWERPELPGIEVNAPHWYGNEPELDGDGVPNADALPWDAFPRDPTETTDADGIGDHADTDDDGDGYTDREEEQAGTDPRSAISFP